MKKIRNLLFILVTTFSFVSLVSADTAITRDMQVGLDTVRSQIYSSTTIGELSCGGKLVTSSGVAMGHTLVTLRGGTYYASPYNNPANGIEDTFVCEYKRIDPRYAGGVNEPGKLTVHIKYVDIPVAAEYNFTLNTYSNKSKSIIGCGDNCIFSDAVAGTISYESDANAKQYLEVGVSGSSVKVSIKNGINISDTVNARIVFTYKTKDGITRTINSNIDITTGIIVFANPGEGNCDFSGWSDVNVNPNVDTGAWAKKSKMKKIKDSSGTVKLPTCNEQVTKEGLPLTFKGWNRYNHNEMTLAADQCMNGILYAPGKSAELNFDTASDTRYFATCYANMNVVIETDGYVESISGWKKASGSLSTTDVYYKTITGNGGVNLPDAKLKNNRKIKGYIRKGGSCNNNNDLLTVNYSVTKPGRYVLCTDTKTTADKKEGDVEDRGHQPLSIVLHASKGNEDIKGEILKAADVVKTSSCKSAGKEVVAKVQNGDCIITGNEATSSPVVVTYEGVTANGVKVVVYFDTTVYKEETITIKVKDKEGTVIDADSGLEANEYATFMGKSNKNIDGCKKFKIGAVTATDADHDPIKIGEITWKEKDKGSEHIKLNAHLYKGKANCEDGRTTQYVGLCLDPGRQEPETDIDYVVEKPLDPGNADRLDNLIANMYNNPAFGNSSYDLQEAVDKISLSNPQENYRQVLAGATFAIRIMSVKLKDDNSNKGLGLNPYWRAYKFIVKLINANVGSGLSSWAALENADPKSQICGGAKPEGSKVSKCEFNTTAAKIGLYWLGKTVTNPDGGEKKKMKIKISSYDPRDLDNGKGKVIDGTITGLTDETGKYFDTFFSVEKYCPKCKDFGIEVKLELGRDKEHMVSYGIKRPDLMKSTYADFAQANPKITSWSDWAKYKDLHLYNEKGVIFFRLTLKNIDLNCISNGVKGMSRQQASKKDTDWKVYLRVSTEGSDLNNNVAITVPNEGLNTQRIVIFNRDGKKTKKGDSADIPGTGGNSGSLNGNGTNNANCFANGTCSGGGGGGCGNPNPIADLNLNGEAELDVYGEGYGPVTYLTEIKSRGGGSVPIDGDEHEVTSILPTCNTSLPMYNYKSCTSEGNCSSEFNPVLFAAANCCVQITDQTHYVYKTYCTDKKCVNDTLSGFCKEKDDDALVEKLKVHEGENSDGKGTMYKCVYDTDTKASKKVKDVAGNKYAISTYKNNEICSVNCKENWDFTAPSLKNHIGSKAIPAGQYFVLQHEDIKSSARRTCVTSFIDLNKFITEVQENSEKIAARFNVYNRLKVQSEVVNENGGINTETIATDVPCCGLGGRFKKNKNCTPPEGSEDSPTTVGSGDDCPEGWSESEANSYDKTACEVGTLDKCTFYRLSTAPVEYHQYTYTYTSGDLTSGTYGESTAQEIRSKSYTSQIYENGDGDCKDDSNPSLDLHGDTGPLETDFKNYVKNNFSAGSGSGGGGDFSSLMNRNDKIAKQLHQCQNFLATTTKSSLNKNEQQNFELLVSYFNPSITFEYEDPEYGQKILGKNELKIKENKESGTVKDTKEVRTLNYYTTSGFDKDTYTYGGAKEEDELKGSGTFISNNTGKHIPKMKDINDGKVHYAEFKPLECTLGGPYSYSGKSKGGKESKSKSFSISGETEAGCWIDPVGFIQNANYVKSTVSHQAQYVIHYGWFQDSTALHREYAYNVTEAMKQSTKKNTVKSEWSSIGNTFLESDKTEKYATGIAFPVSLNAKRNIYQYALKYHNIGMYNDKAAEMGRIMGTTTSVVLNNSRVCFYEVIEGFCACCGDTIDTEVYVPTNPTCALLDGNDSCYKGSESQRTKYYTPQESKTCEGSNCIVSMKSQYVTKSDLNAHPGAGEINVIPTTVSLSSIRENLGREVGANWSETNHYILNGKVYVTDKGARLLDYIEETGEKILENKSTHIPEYSYILPPSAMADIKAYNDENGYQMRANSLIPVKQTVIYSKNSTSDWNTDDTNASSFNHFKSTFLEQNAIKLMETPTYKGKLLSDVNTNNGNGICYVLDTDYKNIKDITTATTLRDINNSQTSMYIGNKANCRWIDYVEPLGKDIGGEAPKEDGYSRLAFK